MGSPGYGGLAAVVREYHPHAAALMGDQLDDRMMMNPHSVPPKLEGSSINSWDLIAPLIQYSRVVREVAMQGCVVH